MDEYEYTADGIFRRIIPPLCPICRTRKNHNGYNTYVKKGLGSIKIGRYICLYCEEPCEEDGSFWIDLKEKFFYSLAEFYQLLRSHHLSFIGISEIMDFIFPRGKDTIYKAFNSSVGRAEIPTINDIVIVHYDEQHPKSGRSQKYRLTLLDHITGQPIADELCDSKDGKTILSFLERNLDPNRPIFIITDLDRGYPAIFKEFFGKNLILQFCLLHLNKLIVKDFPRNTTIEQELIKYRLLNIFYNRDKEIEFLSELVEEEKMMKQDKMIYLKWLKKKKALFKKVH